MSDIVDRINEALKILEASPIDVPVTDALVKALDEVERTALLQPPMNEGGPLKLVLTCSVCPEQYDVYDGNSYVAYLRLRHGQFTAEVEDSLVYTGWPEGDGCFDPDERDAYLTKAVKAIKRRLGLGYSGEYFFGDKP